MPRLLSFLVVTAIIVLATACDKDADHSESTFYGTWVKGTNAGDTLKFYRKNGQDIMLSNQSFNPNMYAPVERQYRYVNGKLVIAYPPVSGGLAEQTIESFTWKSAGRQFEINGFELYMFMSSTQTKFTFTKVR